MPIVILVSFIFESTSLVFQNGYIFDANVDVMVLVLLSWSI